MAKHVGLMVAGVLSIAGAALAAQAPQNPPLPNTPLPNTPPKGDIGDRTSTPHYGRWGYDVAGMDRAILPGNNFYDYADGAAIANIQIPPDRSRWGNFAILAELSQNRVHAILDEMAANAGEAPTTSDAKIGAFYKAFMDEQQIERLGAAPVKPDLDQVRAITSKRDLAALMGRVNDGYFSAIFDVGIEADEKDPNRYSVHLSQSGLDLPDRDYYITPQFAVQKAKYQAYIAQMLQMAGWPEPDANARAVLDLETRIAAASWSRAQDRDPDKTYNAMSVATLEQSAPGFAWRPFLASASLTGVNTVVAAEDPTSGQDATDPKPSFPLIAAIYQQTPLETLKAWEAFHVIDNAAPDLSSAFVQANFEFHNHVLSGQPQIAVRWKRGVNTVDGGMGEAVGQIYVARYFPPESKAKMEGLVADLKAAFRARIERLDWMSPQTKAIALDKLARYTVRIGYPDKWRDYSALTIRSDDLYGDVERSQAFEWAREVRRLDRPVDKAEWDMTPQTVNAYNQPTFNEVVFPAAILQPPFFDPHADAAVNYGGIGGVIGHEMTHGFDDQGRKFDAEGRLRDWWTAADAKRFDSLTARFGAQYSSYEPLPGAHVNGQLTMGENIADLGGLNLALDAYHASLNGASAPMVGGFTGEQRVFLGWAQIWTSKTREDALRRQVVSDPHSPEQYRANGIVRNIDAWYPSFDVKPGQALYLSPPDRVRIW